ncbi:hypothetical protein C8F01DRAFT_1232056 [Mycena amicta]|nr:hypothetical protein C8F01DRAFT_1232056 [Mycena amicta]
MSVQVNSMGRIELSALEGLEDSAQSRTTGTKDWIERIHRFVRATMVTARGSSDACTTAVCSSLLVDYRSSLRLGICASSSSGIAAGDWRVNVNGESGSIALTSGSKTLGAGEQDAIKAQKHFAGFRSAASSAAVQKDLAGFKLLETPELNNPQYGILDPYSPPARPVPVPYKDSRDPRTIRLLFGALGFITDSVVTRSESVGPSCSVIWREGETPRSHEQHLSKSVPLVLGAANAVFNWPDPLLDSLEDQLYRSHVSPVSTFALDCSFSDNSTTITKKMRRGKPYRRIYATPCASTTISDVGVTYMSPTCPVWQYRLIGWHMAGYARLEAYTAKSGAPLVQLRSPYEGPPPAYAAISSTALISRLLKQAWKGNLYTLIRSAHHRTRRSNLHVLKGNNNQIRIGSSSGSYSEKSPRPNKPYSEAMFNLWVTSRDHDILKCVLGAIRSSGPSQSRNDNTATCYQTHANLSGGFLNNHMGYLGQIGHHWNAGEPLYKMVVLYWRGKQH